MEGFKQNMSVTPAAGLCMRATVASRRPPRASDGVIRPAAADKDHVPETPREITAGHTLFLNICTHANTKPPSLPPAKAGARPQTVEEAEKLRKGAPLSTEELLTLDIPLVSGSVRRIPRAQAAWAFDYVVHPSVVRSAQRDATFKAALLKFFQDLLEEAAGLLVVPGSVAWERAPGGGAGATHYVGGVKPAGGGPEVPVPCPVGQGTGGSGGGGIGRGGMGGDDVDVRRALGLTGAAGKSGKGGAGAPASAASAALASPSSLLRALDSSSSLGGAAGDGGAGGGLVRELDGLRLTGGAITEPGSDAAAGASSAAAPGASEEAASAEQFASYFASLLPEKVLVHEGACRFSCDVGGAGEVVARLQFDPVAVDVANLQLADAELDVAPDRVSLRLPRALLPRYTGLAIPLVTVVHQALPVKVDPDSAKAKFSRKAASLTVTLRKV
jgi:hypothetical protein